MARNITLQFGLLSVAAKSDVATIKATPMTNLCVGQPGKDAHPASPVRQPKVCEACGPITDLAVLKKGVKVGAEYTLIEQSAIAEAKAEFTKDYKGKLTLAPHPAGPFLGATAPADSLNYLTPADASNADHYQLLVRLIESHPELVFASLHTPSSATALFRVLVRDGVLVMEKRVREESLKPAPSVGGVVNDALYAMLDSTLAQFVTDYDPAAYEDAYGRAVAAMIAEGETVSADAATPVTMTDDELMAKMKALTEAAR